MITEGDSVIIRENAKIGSHRIDKIIDNFSLQKSGLYQHDIYVSGFYGSADIDRVAKAVSGPNIYIYGYNNFPIKENSVTIYKKMKLWKRININSLDYSAFQESVYADNEYGTQYIGACRVSIIDKEIIEFLINNETFYLAVSKNNVDTRAMDISKKNLRDIIIHNIDLFEYNIVRPYYDEKKREVGFVVFTKSENLSINKFNSKI